jgi:hypothetical protein
MHCVDDQHADKIPMQQENEQNAIKTKLHLHAASLCSPRSVVFIVHFEPSVHDPQPF